MTELTPSNRILLVDPGLTGEDYFPVDSEDLDYYGDYEPYEREVYETYAGEQSDGLIDLDEANEPRQGEYPVPRQTYSYSAYHYQISQLRRGAVGEFMHGISEDAAAAPLIVAFSGMKQARTPGPGTEYRAITPMMSGIMTSPESRRSLMGAIDETVTTDSNDIKELARRNGGLQVDVLIVGAGVQGSVAATRLRAENAQLSILSIDKSRRIGGQFRSYGTRPTFYINSRSDRPELDDVLALPGGVGNLNPLGEKSPMQLTNVSVETYPTNTDIGDVAAINQYLAAPTLLETELVHRESSDATGEVVTARDTITGEEIIIDAQKVLVLTGSGERADSRKDENIWTAEEVLAHFGNEDNQFPMAEFIGKDLAIKGGGDTGRIIAELFTRLAPKEAYGSSVAQLGGPVSITWYGVNFESREEFCETNRPRYQRLRPYIANVDESLYSTARLIRPDTAKVKSAVRDGSEVRLTNNRGENRYYDLLIDASTLKNKATEISGLPRDLTSIEKVVDGLGTVMVGRVFDGTDVYLGGPAAKTSLTPSERSTFPASILENTVAIWANEPRVDALATTIAGQIQPRRSAVATAS